MKKSLPKIQILLIEDNRLLRDGIAAILKKQPDMHVVAALGKGENILGMIGDLKPNLLLMDLGLRDRNSLQLVKLSRKKFPEVKIIIMDFIPLQADIYEFVKAGVSGFMIKDINVTEFLNTIRSVNEGKKILPKNLTGSLFSEIVIHALNGAKNSTLTKSVRMTKREKQVIELIAEGLTNKEIAQKLFLSTYTIKSHVHNILEKLALNTRVEIAKHAHLSESYKTAMNNTSLMD